MQAKESGFSVLSVPVASCDRRALSEAWFSALRLNRSEHGPALARGGVQQRHRACALPRPSAVAAHELSAGQRSVASLRATRSGPCGEDLAIQRARPRSTLAQKIIRTFLARNPCARQASFTLESGKARVHIVVRATGLTTRIVALCTSGSRSFVAQALEDAQTALIAQGLRVRAGLHEVTR